MQYGFKTDETGLQITARAWNRDYYKNPQVISIRCEHCHSTGADVAIETADITLIKGDLHGVAGAISLSRKTMRTIRQNLFWAFIYNIIGIPVAALGLLNPMFAAAAMAFSSVLLSQLTIKGKDLKDMGKEDITISLFRGAMIKSRIYC